ncbi:MAG: efflux RND transporter periplasmic adaptor subunit [Acidobacteria bacterium]|nr:MAG: efflux RND transporter periplasmic adaptor subunit [Acidobacteriota bacterium]REK03325.1 MAG: efflux RND transporter periplasmic adaptor subunit [Acidobacteriota bacterium]
MRRIVITAAMVLAVGGIVVASLLSDGRSDSGVEVYLEAAEVGELARVIKASGKVDPRVKVDISAHVIGKIERLYVEEGDEVRAGQPFLLLEQEAFLAVRDRAAAQLEIARSQVRQAEINLADSEIRLRRARRLREESVLSEESADQVELNHKSAQLALEQAREAVRQATADLEKAEDDLTKTTIYSPLDGRVIALNAEQGEVVVSGTMNNPASVIGTVADLSEILVEIDVDENEIVLVERDQPTRVFVDAIPDHAYAGHVVEIGSSGFERPGQQDVTFFKVKVLLDEPDGRLRPGMSARAEIEVERKTSALRLPIQAVVYREAEDAAESREEKVVYVAATADTDGEDATAERRVVETGISDATHIEITDGLSAGELVVTGPYRTLRDLEDGESLRRKEPEDQASTSEGD